MTIMEWLRHGVTVFGLSVPVWMLLVLAFGPVVEYLLGRFAPTKCASLIALIATGLRAVLTITRIGSIPLIGTGLVRVLESIAGVDLDGDGQVGDPTPPPPPTRIGPALVLLLALAVGSSGCAAVMSNLPQVIAEVQDAELVIGMIQRIVDEVFVAHPDPKSQAIVDGAIQRVISAADLVNRAAQGAQDLDGAQTDAAFKEFEAAWNDLQSILGPYAISFGDAPRATRTASGGYVLPRPVLLARAARK